MYLGQQATPPAASPSWTEMLQQAVPAAVQLYRERAATKMQMQRAAQGLPPLPVEMYSPPIRVQGGVDRPTLMLLGAGVAGVLGLVWFMGRRRRV